MKKKYIIVFAIFMLLAPLKTLAAGGFSVSPTNISLYPGESKTITISTNNAVGQLNISSSNSSVASISPSSIFIQNPGSNGAITVTANSVGTSTISVVASSNFATMDEEILEGQTKTITINVVAKPAPQPTPVTPSPTPTPTPQPSINLSSNNNIKDLKVEGYELVKVDNNNYTLTVQNEVTSINISATTEDTKAKITGTGKHELSIGENNIQIIVTSESGINNIYNLKITRKDGYYIEDLDHILKKEDIKELNVIINKDNEITKEQLETIKNNQKTIKLNYYNEDKNLTYSWIIDGSQLKNLNNFKTAINFNSNSSKDISKLSNYADGLYINFEHNGELPTGVKVQLYVGDKFEDGSIVNLFQYNDTKNSLTNKEKNIEVKDGYIEFDIKYCSEYFITMSTIDNANIENKSSNNILWILSIVEFAIIILLAIALVINVKKNNKQNTISI